MDIKNIVKKAGGTKKVAASLGLTYQAVHKWEKVPTKYVHKIASMSGVKPEKIRPEMFV